MALAPGTRFGPYEVLSALGAGGMGEVYRARDTRLHRDVALKVLPDAFAADPDRMARFEREAQVLASLNHSNIAQIFGLEQAGSTRALAMELVAGEDLSQRIARGAIPLDEALPVARQIASALEAAHALGIVHRDLKPANIKVTADGQVKVLDFGLAKAVVNDGVRPGEAPASPIGATMTSPAMTAMGMVLGTAAYMAPEQARGRAVDKRADIWAFGCVLFEMLTGTRLFAGEDMTETLAAVVKEQPDLSPAPREVRRLIAKCLEKDPKRRLRDIGDVWELLDEPSRAESAPVVRRPSRLPWIVAAAATAAAVALAGLHFSEATRAPGSARFEVSWPDPVNIGGFAVSPDGRQLAIVSGAALWIRHLDNVEAVRLAQTDGATYPFWSADSAWIGFFAGGQLKKVSPSGGNPQTICPATDGRGASWSRNGTILFSDSGGSRGLSRVPEAGGSAVPVTTLSTSGSRDAHRYPHFLPDGEHFLFLHLSPTAETGGVFVGALDGTPPVRLRAEQEAAVYTTSSAGDGYLLFRRQGTLMAEAFDPDRRQTSGAVFPVAENVGVGSNTGVGAFSASASGTLAHGMGVNTARRMVWLDRAGKPVGTATGDSPINSFALSRDERRLALGITTSAALDTDIWVSALPAGAPSKLTFGPAPGWFSPVWSPTGSEIAYATTDLAGLAGYEIRRKRSDMAGKEETLFRATSYLRTWDWSADGKWLVYSDGNDDLLFLPMSGDRKPIQVTKTLEQESYGQLSTDGRWLAYTAGDRAAPQVFVQPVPATGAKWLVSAGGGSQPRWRRDGKELYYRRADGQLMAVSIAGASAALEHGAPQPLFGGIPGYGNLDRFTYQPSADGQRFLVSATAESSIRPITVVLNWPGANR